MLARKVPTVSASEHCNTYAILFQMAEGNYCNQESIIETFLLWTLNI